SRAAGGTASPWGATRVGAPSAPRTTIEPDEAKGPPGSWVGPASGVEGAGEAIPDAAAHCAGASRAAAATLGDGWVGTMEPGGLDVAELPVRTGMPQIAAATT